MPNFNFLKDDELSAIATYLFNLGDRVAQERMILPPDVYAGMENPKDYTLVADGGQQRSARLADFHRDRPAERQGSLREILPDLPWLFR